MRLQTNRRHACTALALGVLLALPTSGAAAPTGATRITEVEGITEYRLENGLKVLLFPDPSVSTVTINVTYLVGSRHEGRGEAGMAHLLEHMVFKGTPTFPNIWGALQDHGANFNGTTWVDRTNYYETLAASQENIEFALKMEADRMVNSLIRGEELAKEMTVVRNEFEARENSPSGVLLERMLSTAYLWHNYGKSTIGNRSDIERVPADSLRRFYEKYYQPDNAMLVVSGNFDRDWTLDRIVHYFAAIPRPERALSDTYTVEPPQDGPRSVVLRRVGGVASAGLVYHIPAGSHDDFPALEVLGEVLTDRPSGRLYKTLVAKDKAVNVRHSAFSWRDPGVLVLQSSVRVDQDIDEAQAILIEQTESLGGSVTRNEVARAKNKLLKEINLGMTDSRRIGILLSEWEALGDWRIMFVQRDRLKAVDAEAVNRVAESYLIASNRTAGTFIPSAEPRRAEIPEAPNVAALVKDYQGSESIATGSEFESTAINIERSVWRGKAGPMKVALLAKETRGRVVHARLRFPYGTEATLVGRTTAARIMPALMMRGTKHRSYQELRDELNRIETELTLGGDIGFVSARIKTTADHLAEAIGLLAEILQSPSLPASELEVIRKEQLAQLERLLTDPQGLVFSELNRATNPYPAGSLYYRPSLKERIANLEALELAEIRELHQRFLGSEHGEASFVGDFDPPTLKKLLSASFGKWSAPEPYARLARHYLPAKALDETINTPDKKMAIVARGATFPLRDDHPDYASLQFANFILGESAKSRLLNSLRHEGGLSYGAGSLLQVDDRDTRGSITGFAICAPQNATEAQQVMQEEFRRWVNEPPPPAEIEEFRIGYTEAFRTRLSNDAFVASQLLADLPIDRPFTFHQKVVDAAGTLTAEKLHAALQQHLGDAPFVDLKGGDVVKFGGGGTGSGQD